MKQILKDLWAIFRRIVKGVDIHEPDFHVSQRFVVGKPLSRGGPLLIKVNDAFRKAFLSPGVCYPNYSCRKLIHSGIGRTEDDHSLCMRLNSMPGDMVMTEPELWHLLQKSRLSEETFFSSNANFAFMKDGSGRVWRISFCWDKDKQIGEGWSIGAHTLDATVFGASNMVVFYPGNRIPAPIIHPS